MSWSLMERNKNIWDTKAVNKFEDKEKLKMLMWVIFFHIFFVVLGNTSCTLAQCIFGSEEPVQEGRELKYIIC